MDSCEGHGKSSWPELVGSKGATAVLIIKEENPHVVDARIVLEGKFITPDFRCDRVWVWVDRDERVTRVPQLG